MSGNSENYKMEFHVFEAGAFSSWNALFSEVANFATKIGRDRVLSISHSEDKEQAVVTVWYWTDTRWPVN